MSSLVTSSLSQSPSEVFMVRPGNFMFNMETAVTNHYQDKTSSNTEWHGVAMQEFDQAVETLRKNKVRVTVFQDTEDPAKPDAIFPNNWISCHQTGEVVLYPMATPNRRLERRMDVVQWLKDDFSVTRVVDLSSYEDKGRYLEGTGSIVFDHTAMVAYACSSVRTDKGVLERLCEEIGYSKVLVEAADSKGRPIYHTNVFMSIATDFVVICMDAVQKEVDRKMMKDSLEQSGKKVITVTQDQVDSLAANCYEVVGMDGRRKLIISTRGWGILTEGQRERLSAMVDIVQCRVDTIEAVGGGGIRCMLAPVFCNRI
eukprot:TRINITY_DN8341_c0_g1_i2.p1 TRINITY_DN8341_c0_g1~~TRINITY_DN8341_c0_g1_i2.p1  ORF type:complete len:314 (+),score=144.19 TRINITY_DN8341_c0_g1_i2:111-1052(+)